MEQPDVNNKPDKTEYELILQAMAELAFHRFVAKVDLKHRNLIGQE